MNFLKILNAALECMNMILLHINHRHVSASHVAILSVVTASITFTHSSALFGILEISYTSLMQETLNV